MATKIMFIKCNEYEYELVHLLLISVCSAVQSALYIRAPKYSFDFADDSKKAFQCICVVRGIHDQMNIDSR